MEKKFIAGIITVPERKAHLDEVVAEFKSKGIETVVFTDEKHKGHYFNSARMLKHFCYGHYSDYNIILCSDDISFQDWWYRLLNDILDNTDYRVIGGFSNKNPKVTDDKYGLHEITTRFAMYDPLQCYRAGVLNKDFYDGIMEYAKRPDAHKKELHFDNLVSSYLFDKKFKCAITVPNIVIHKDIPSICGNVITKSKEIKDEEALLAHFEEMKKKHAGHGGLLDALTSGIENLMSACQDDDERINAVNTLVSHLHGLNPVKQPVGKVLWVPVEMVEPNDYNPNAVAGKEMSLLYTSISHDGYTQPVVTIWDDIKLKYIIVDGFHRYFTCKNNPDILERNKGRLPIVVIEKDINDRMAATVRHNRARGKHSVDGMSSMVFSMLANGWDDAGICNELGMEAEELVRLKHITGFSKLFANAEYRKAWESKNQLLERKQYQEKHPDEKIL